MNTNISKWTNKSVLALAKDRDPVDAIVQKARELVLRVLDAGWSGPPFDPIAVADYLKLEIIAKDDVTDARLIPAGRTKIRPLIEFNPNRPRGRVRFSIAHEIAHTLFPDVTETIRYRATHKGDLADDSWQLEALCNIAAAEIVMPLGSLHEQVSLDRGINSLLELRQAYDVSMEAMLIRTVNVTEKPHAMFCASRNETEKQVGDFQIDYLIGSSGWSSKINRGASFSRKSIINECTAIGYTAIGDEKLAGVDYHVECVGLPPYPHSRTPRVAGLISPKRNSMVANRLAYLKGDALEPRGEEPKMIVHIVNDATPNWGGRGFATALKSKWPAAQEDFRSWVKQTRGALSLGSVRFFNMSDDVVIASMVCQKGYGVSDKPRLRYSALRECLLKVAHTAQEKGLTVHMPRIGSGNAQGAWHITQELITSILSMRGLRVNIYELPNAARKPDEQQTGLNLFTLGHDLI